VICRGTVQTDDTAENIKTTFTLFSMVQTIFVWYKLLVVYRFFFVALMFVVFFFVIFFMLKLHY